MYRKTQGYLPCATVFIFFWEAEDAAPGWWVAYVPGSDGVWAYNADATAGFPPRRGWQVPGDRDAVDQGMAVIPHGDWRILPVIRDDDTPQVTVHTEEHNLSLGDYEGTNGYGAPQWSG